MPRNSIPAKQGLYDPQFEHDACGVGFVVDIKGRRSSEIIRGALEVLGNLEHRGACGSEANTGDGAGILLQIPHGLLAQECHKLGFSLPSEGQYGVGMIFLPPEPGSRLACETVFERVVVEEGQNVIGWRTVPTDDSMIGETARRSEPTVRQIFIGRGNDVADRARFERKLYIIRKRVEKEIDKLALSGLDGFYVCSLSSKTIIYKGMLTAAQLSQFYPELTCPRVETALALVHSRFSTNTFPSWARAHPYRYIAHNGEINTLRGNVNWMRARESMFKSRLFGGEIQKILPVIDPKGSDSAMFDNVAELLTLAGRPLPHVLTMMIPEPWSGHEAMSE
ncbi:MAG TPA: glutamate synthase subunit alpha, partial [Blastocatellia bacterium]